MQASLPYRLAATWRSMRREYAEMDKSDFVIPVAIGVGVALAGNLVVLVVGLLLELI